LSRLQDRHFVFGHSLSHLTGFGVVQPLSSWRAAASACQR
jgi:hypothetical protein